MGDTEAPRCHSHLQVMTPPEHRGHPGLGLGLSLPAPLPLTLRIRILGIVLICGLRMRRRSPARNRELRQQLRGEALRLERSADDLALLRRSPLLVSARPAVSSASRVNVQATWARREGGTHLDFCVTSFSWLRCCAAASRPDCKLTSSGPSSSLLSPAMCAVVGGTRRQEGRSPRRDSLVPRGGGRTGPRNQRTGTGH